MLHKNSQPEDNHMLPSWVVANAAARLALAVLPADVYKLCLQLDTGLSYLLMDDSPMTWQSLATPAPTQCIPIACSDESTALTVGTAKVTFRMPFAFTLTSVKASLTTAQASGSIFTVDINEAGASILSTKLTIDNTEKTTATAATPAVISDNALAADAEITIDIDQIGTSGATGLKVYLIGTA